MKPTDTVMATPIFIYNESELPKIIHMFEEACKMEMIIHYLKKGENHAADN